MRTDESVRIAHLTDIHVAASIQSIFDALKFLSYTAPALGGIVYTIDKFIRRLPPGVRIPARIITLLAGTLSGGVAVILSEKARTGLQFVIALMFMYNRSLREDRRLLFESLHENNVDHVIITGDLTNTSRREEFEMICEEMKRYDWWGNRVTVVPGNHDRIGFPRSESFENYFGEFYAKIPPEYPIIREIIPGVIVACFDTCLPQEYEDMWGRIFTNVKGFISQQQLQRFSNAMRDFSEEIVILGLHHPPFARWAKPWPGRLRRSLYEEPKNSLELINVIKNKKHLVMCGHDHPKQPIFEKLDQINLAQSNASGLRLSHKITYRIITVSPNGVSHVDTVEIPL